MYLIFTKIGKKKNWVRDAGGQQFIKQVLNPIIALLNKLMKIYSDYNMDKFDYDFKVGNINTILLENSQLSKSLDCKSYCDKLKTDTLRYMASKFAISDLSAGEFTRMSGKKKEIVAICE